MFFSACLYVSVLILSSTIGMTLQESYPGSKGENIHKRVRRMLNGTEMTSNSSPYVVYLGINDDLCVGTILDKHTIVTAAHCFDSVIDSELDEYYLIAGGHSIMKFGKEVQIMSFEFEEYVIYEDYEQSTFEDDIAILNLEEPLKMAIGTVQCLNINMNGLCPAVGDTCSVAGWSVTETNGVASEVPLKIDLKVVENFTCKPNLTQNDKIIYAEGNEGKNFCQGHSWGPLVCSCGGRQTFSGIVSRVGGACAEPGCPTVFTRVSWFGEWIDKNRKYRCNRFTQCRNIADTEVKIHGPATDSGHLLTIFSLENVIIMLTTFIIVWA